MLATLTWWRSLVRIQPGLQRSGQEAETGVVFGLDEYSRGPAATAPRSHRGKRRFESCREYWGVLEAACCLLSTVYFLAAEWTGAVPSTVSYAVRRRFESGLRNLSLSAEYANRQSGQVESLVIDCGFDSHLGYSEGHGLLVQLGRHLVCTQEIGVQLPGGPFPEGSRIRLAGPLC